MKMKLFSMSLAAAALGGGLAASTAFAQYGSYGSTPSPGIRGAGPPDPVPHEYIPGRNWQTPADRRNEQYNRNLATPGGGGTPSCAMTQNPNC